MADDPVADRRRVVIVTGGGAGIGAAIAEELGRTGAFVITMDPLVSVDGAEQLPTPEETTAGRIVAAGGSARSSATSVTDREGVRALFAEVAHEFGGLDAVVNVAGITRPTAFTLGSEDDWRSVVSVHLAGYCNVLDAALPIMAAAGRGHILGVTSGSGWRAADTGAYGCAKRAVASLTWQLGRVGPPGVVINAISPIAMTRMVTAALGRRPAAASTAGAPKGSSPKERSSNAGSSSTGGLSLASMPAPEQLGPLAAHMVDAGFAGCGGQVVFTAGTEVAVIDEPRLLEVLDSVPRDTRDDRASLGSLLDAALPGAFVPAEEHQQSQGGSNARLASTPDDTAAPAPGQSTARTCAVVSDRAELAQAVTTALEARGVICHPVSAASGDSFDGAASALGDIAERHGPIDGVVVALVGARGATAAPGGWERTVADHMGAVDGILADARWARSVADLAAGTDASLRLVTLSDAGNAGGQSRAQASAQLARAARGATDEHLTAFAVAVEATDAHAIRSAGELAAHLVCSPAAPPLSGAELVVGTGTIGLRSHPRVGTALIFSDSAVPTWFDAALEGIVR